MTTPTREGATLILTSEMRSDDHPDLPPPIEELTARLGTHAEEILAEQPTGYVRLAREFRTLVGR